MIVRPRLLVVISSGVVGGAERYAVRVARDAAREMEVVVACRRSEAMAPLRRELREDGIRILDLPRGERLRGFLGFVALCALLSPDVVHLTLPWPRAASEIRLALAVLRQRSVLVHALVPAADNIVVKNRWFYGWSYRRNQRWVAVSAYGRQMLGEITGVPVDDVIVIRNDAPELIRPDGARRTASRRRLRAELGLGDDARTVVSVGRLAREKGHDVLIDAAAALATRYDEIAILIAGVGPEREALQTRILARGLDGAVRLLGSRPPDEIAELLNGADAFAFPSRMEGHPLALLEAIALGVPAVVTRFGGADEVIEDGHTGRLVPMDDPDALARELSAILDDPEAARRDLVGAEGTVPPTFGMLDRTRALLLDIARGSAGP